MLKRQLITSVEYTQCTICYIGDLFESFLVCVIRVSDLVRCFYLGKILVLKHKKGIYIFMYIGKEWFYLMTLLTHFM